MKARMMNLKLAALLGAALVTTVPAMAQAKKEADPAKQTEKKAMLKAGDRAPEFKVERFVKGQPITGFEKGQVYVVEFWATWCGPCIKAFPHLSELQKEYKDQGVTIIGTNVWETREYNDETYTKVEKFVADKGDIMGYTVAYDGAAQHMTKEWMSAAGQNGIPAAFVIDKEGKIAWIGHPMQLDYVLPGVVDGSWSPEKADAIMAKQMKGMAGKHVDAAIAKKDAEALNEIAWGMVDPAGHPENPDLNLALKAATAADEITEHKNAMIIDTLARVHFVRGDVAKAIELQTKAVELAPAGFKAEMTKALEEYKSKK